MYSDQPVKYFLETPMCALPFHATHTAWLPCCSELGQGKQERIHFFELFDNFKWPDIFKVKLIGQSTLLLKIITICDIFVC